MKFRVRCNETNCIWIGEGFYFITNDGSVFDKTQRNVTDLVKIERFTGQEDRNGVEIYEGDTVKNSSDFEGKVEWFNSRSKFGIRISDHSHYDLIGWSCEVIS